MRQCCLLVQGANLDLPVTTLCEVQCTRMYTKVLPKPVRRGEKHLVQFFALLLLRKCPVLINCCYCRVHSVSIIYKLPVASQFCSSHTKTVVTDSFSRKNADWSGHVPTSRNQTRLEVFKMDLLEFILKISAYQQLAESQPDIRGINLTRVVSSSSKCEKENAL